MAAWRYRISLLLMKNISLKDKFLYLQVAINILYVPHFLPCLRHVGGPKNL